MDSVDKMEVKMSTRRSRKVMNLEEEVEYIFSQDESDNEGNIKEELLAKTASTNDKAKAVTTPKASQAVLQELLQTPRRSCRKSIKPTQEYDDIVNKSLRSCTRSTKKYLITTEEEAEEDIDNQENEVMHAKWTPAKVGRVSQKRSRKSRRNGKGKKDDFKEIKEQGDEENRNEHLFFGELNEETEVIVGNKNDLHQTNTTEENEIANMAEELKKSSELEITNQASRNEHETEVIDQVEEIKNDAERIVKTEFYGFQEVQNIIPQKQDVVKIDNNVLEGDEDDSEDFKESVQNSNENEILIVYEDNISNNKIKDESEDDTHSLSSCKKIPKEEFGDSFGCYLKSKEINISDLGLNPLKDEEDDKDENKIAFAVKSQDADEMPSLIICDDEEDGKLNNKLNETFEAIESGNGGVVENLAKPNEEIMETLQISDDECETPRKRPRIVLTNTDLQNQTIWSTPKRSPKKVKLPSTPTLVCTSKQSAVAVRIPTPYRRKQHVQIKNEKSTSKIPVNNTSMISLTTMEPKEMVLHGIRKRSLSVCIDGNEQRRQKFLAGPLAKVKQDRIVSFYSPANQTTIIDDLDMMIAKSLKEHKPQENKDSLNRFVTTRRKRSMSFDESMMSNLQISKLPRPVSSQYLESKTQTSSSSAKPLLRTKLPNFAAIHQKQFQKMENLVEHVSRKQERSKNLINSTTKLRPVSAQKNISIIKNSTNIVNEKPKALKKIDLGGTAQVSNSLHKTTTATGVLNRMQDVSVTKILNDLPDPRLATTKPLKSAAITHRQPQQQIKKYLKPSQTINIEKAKVITKTVTAKPTFDLSTSVMVKSTSSSKSFVERANISHMSNEDKVASRLQRHMDLFKGRNPSARAGVASSRNEVILKGVRSNRRFELQMQHRKNMEQ